MKVSGWHQVFDQKTLNSNVIICVEDDFFFCQEHIEVTLLCWSHLNVVWTLVSSGCLVTFQVFSLFRLSKNWK